MKKSSGRKIRRQAQEEVPEMFKCACCGRDVRKPFTEEEICSLAREFGVSPDSAFFDDLRQAH